MTFATVQPTATLPSTPRVPVASPFDAVPGLDPLPQTSTTTAVVVAEPPPRRGFWSSLFTPTPSHPKDPNIDEANRAVAQSERLRWTLSRVHELLPNNARILEQAPHQWEQLFTQYDAARASTIAMLSGLKTRLDTAAAAGATAALSAPSRARFEAAAINVRSADAECASLRSAAQLRHAEALEESERAAQAAAVIEQKRATFREDLKHINGARRASIEERLEKLSKAGYGFAFYAFDDPARPGTAEVTILAPMAVIPTLADKQRVVFNKVDQFWRIAHEGSRVISSGAELEDIVDEYMGRGDAST